MRLPAAVRFAIAMVGEMKMIYLDHNGSTPLAPDVKEAMLPYLEGRFANPSGSYRAARQARAAIEHAREQVAALVDAHPGQVIFTSGATEANNLALQGWAQAAGLSRGLAVSAVEHASVRVVAHALTARGVAFTEIAVDKTGLIDASGLDEALVQLRARGAGGLVSVMYANNETGVIQDLPAIAEQVRNAGAWLHSDAAQAAGKIEVDFAASGVHLMSLSAHKLYGPKGIGALVVDKVMALTPLLYGGGHERGLRAGTENVAAIVGFGVAAEIARRELAARSARMRDLRDYLERRLRALPQVVLFGELAPRLPNTVCLAVPGLDGESLVMRLDQHGLALSSGANCSSGQPSHVLLAMGVAPDLARCALRVSLGEGNTVGDIDALIEALVQEIEASRSAAAAWAPL